MVGKSYERFRPGSFSLLSWKLEKKHYISPEELATTLLQNRGQVIPDEVLDYTVAMLRRKTKRPSGRPRKSTFAQLREIYAVSCYERYFAWLQKRQAGAGVRGWNCIREADWWAGPPHERAAKMTVRRFRGGKWNVSERYIRNLVSSFKSPRH